MKLKINKACDLGSTYVFPPHTRRSSLPPSVPQSSQLRSQPSQQSFSQGISSQHALFSQISQNSLDEIVTTDQRFGSQERENAANKISCLVPNKFTREDSQGPISRSSTVRKWNSVSAQEHRCQTSEELEHRMSVIETSLNRFGMILDSVQSGVMQVNKGTKEVLLEMAGMRQRLIAEVTYLHLMAITGNAKTLVQNGPVATGLPPKLSGCCETPKTKPLADKKQAVPQKVYEQTSVAPEVYKGGWKYVKMKQPATNERAYRKENDKRKGVSSVEQETYRILIESDEEIDAGFSCLLSGKETGSIHLSKHETT
ncbi:Recombination initiation defects 3, putative isoform 2 [Hibiscus syriacus]|uniref:Recombination initiation defects 3, putative isoform 2 n=1 Tax=Hibiscus syriacus TaxID=106335 RepID=A0A6A3CJS9_HIBSY|nr:Recombination initiation defects 3, putative isoform 2 [Hibiscus syriacus]